MACYRVSRTNTPSNSIRLLPSTNSSVHTSINVSSILWTSRFFRRVRLSIDITLSQKDLAEFAGTTIETVNRTLKIWEQREYIRRSRQHIDLLDRLALMAVAEDQLYMGQRF